MKDADRIAFAKALARLAAIFRTEIPDETAAAYWDTLAPKLSIKEFVLAGDSLAAGPRFPIPKDFLDCIHGTPEDRAEKAWQLAWAKVHSVGAYQSPDFADPAIIATIREMGGWPDFCRPEGDPTWHRKRFLEVYRGFDAHRASLQEIRALRGQHEQENDAAGLKAPEWAYRELPAKPTQGQLPQGDPN